MKHKQNKYKQNDLNTHREQVNKNTYKQVENIEHSRTHRNKQNTTKQSMTHRHNIKQKNKNIGTQGHNRKNESKQPSKL